MRWIRFGQQNIQLKKKFSSKHHETRNKTSKKRQENCMLFPFHQMEWHELLMREESYDERFALKTCYVLTFWSTVILFQSQEIDELQRKMQIPGYRTSRNGKSHTEVLRQVCVYDGVFTVSFDWLSVSLPDRNLSTGLWKVKFLVKRWRNSGYLSRFRISWWQVRE